MRAANELAGRCFGRLRVISRAGSAVYVKRTAEGRIEAISKIATWNCVCDPALGGCGSSCIARSDQLKHGRKRSCGCLRREWGRHLGAATKERRHAK